MGPFQKNYLCLMFTALTAILLVGCNDIVVNGALPNDYTFHKDGQYGVLAFTSSCDIAEGTGQLSFSHDGLIGKKSIKTINNPVNYHVLFECNSFQEGFSQPELKLVDLPIGEYNLYAWSIYSGRYRTYSPPLPEKFYFPIYPNKLTYIGRLQLEKGYSDRWRLIVKNGAAQDLPVIQHRLPLIPEQDYVVILPIIDK